MIRRYAFIALFFASFVLPLSAQPIKLGSIEHYSNIAQSLEFNLAQSTANTPPIEGWSEYDKSVIQLYNSLDTHWFRTKLVNNSVHPKSYYLEFANPLVDEITVYILAGGKVRTMQQIGDQQHFNLRPILHESFVLPLQFKENEELELYFSINSPSYLKVPVKIWQVESFQQEHNYQRLINGVYLGLVIAMIFATIFAFIYHKQLLVLFDGLFLFALLMITLTASGIGFHYIWPSSPDFQQHAFFLFACFAMFFSALAASKNMQLFFHDLRLIRLFQSLAVVSLLLIPASFLLSYQLGIFLIIGLSILVCISHLVTGIISWRQGLHEHQELNFGLMFILIALLIISLNTFDWVHLPISNYQVLQLSILAQVLFMLITAVKSYGVGFNTFGDVNEEEDDKDLLLSEQMLELQFALKELQEKNEQLEKLNTLDELSGIHNRRHFDKRLQAEIRRGRRELSPLSLIMFDIDHFKQFNDNYGHIAGDEVIRAVALTASQQLNRPTDEIFRYGGEEYAVLLPNTDIDGANVLAENIRRAIESQVIVNNERSLQCTISLGVACHLSEQVIQPKSFIELADKALYQAKENGRNQVATSNKNSN